MTKIPKISQSLMKAYVDYLNGKLCGLLFKAKYIDKDKRAETPPSDAMKAGIYFEYLCTGALPKSKEIPEPEYAYAGTSRQKLSAAYERAQRSAELFKTIIHHYNIEIIQVGLYLSTDEIDGVMDIHAKWNGKDVFIDLKYSGLIDDKWNEMGWDLDSLPLKDSLMVQGVHYKILANEVLGIDDIPFYYFVFDSGNSQNAKIILQNVDESRYSAHKLAIDNLKNKLVKDMNFGFKAYPSLKSCSSCPIKGICDKATSVPIIDYVDY